MVKVAPAIATQQFSLSPQSFPIPQQSIASLAGTLPSKHSALSVPLLRDILSLPTQPPDASLPFHVPLQAMLTFLPIQERRSSGKDRSTQSSTSPFRSATHAAGLLLCNGVPPRYHHRRRLHLLQVPPLQLNFAISTCCNERPGLPDTTHQRLSPPTEPSPTHSLVRSSQHPDSSLYYEPRTHHPANYICRGYTSLPPLHHTPRLQPTLSLAVCSSLLRADLRAQYNNLYY